MPDRSQSIPIDLSEITEGTRRALYDAVVAVHFTATREEVRAARKAEEWYPTYGPDECRLSVFHFAGRWFVIWRQWDAGDDVPEEQEWFILTARPALDAPFGVQFQEV
jgi:hypothetical protein